MRELRQTSCSPIFKESSPLIRALQVTAAERDVIYEQLPYETLFHFLVNDDECF